MQEDEKCRVILDYIISSGIRESLSQTTIKRNKLNNIILNSSKAESLLPSQNLQGGVKR